MQFASLLYHCDIDVLTLVFKLLWDVVAIRRVLATCRAARGIPHAYSAADEAETTSEEAFWCDIALSQFCKALRQPLQLKFTKEYAQLVRKTGKHYQRLMLCWPREFIGNYALSAGHTFSCQVQLIFYIKETPLTSYRFGVFLREETLHRPGAPGWNNVDAFVDTVKSIPHDERNSAFKMDIMFIHCVASTNSCGPKTWIKSSSFVFDDVCFTALTSDRISLSACLKKELDSGCKNLITGFLTDVHIDVDIKCSTHCEEYTVAVNAKMQSTSKEFANASGRELLFLGIPYERGDYIKGVFSFLDYHFRAF